MADAASAQFLWSAVTVSARHGVKVVKAVTIDRQAADLYRAWRNFAGLPRFMRHLVSVSVFDDRQSAVRANEQARGWVVSNLGVLLPDPPEVLAGEALLQAFDPRRRSGAG